MEMLHELDGYSTLNSTCSIDADATFGILCVFGSDKQNEDLC